MTDLKSFKTIRIQWHRAVFASDFLTASDKALAAYLINVRLNWSTGQLNPAIATIAADMCVDPRTIQRCVNKLEHLGWIWTSRGKGRSLSSNYFVTDESIAISERIKCEINALTPEDRMLGKTDTSVTLSIVKPWQERRAKVTPLSRKRRQECHSNSKTNSIKTNDDKNSLNLVEAAEKPKACPSRSFRVILETDERNVVAWNHWLVEHGFPKLNELGILGEDATGKGYQVPRLFVPSDERGLEEVRSYFRWAATRCKRAVGNGQDVASL